MKMNVLQGAFGDSERRSYVFDVYCNSKDRCYLPRSQKL